MGLTFLAVHAHPDDEASSTGGLFRRLADEGVRTVLVTCTNGECGDALDGAKPDADHHDGDQVAKIRAVELDRAVEVLGISRLVRLGYRDSGMMGWPQNDDPDSFWATPIEDAATKLAEVLREERPQVIMTYNAYGFYGHPDHIQAHRVTLAAIALLDYEPTLYFNAVPDSVMATWRERWAEEDRLRREADLAAGREPEPEFEPANEDGDEINMGTPDDQIDVAVDVRAVADAKFDALAAHASQIGDSFWMKMGRERFREEMRFEWFVRAANPLGLSGLADDVFVGYR
ncbi:MAG: PIG-L family deacetylase [Acidobacteriota bacterium]|nr:PIG-L family deacetylase [Acidobacteriota bacterium]MDE3043971.1 PIG-L family deacetylase [Acidobacteriota bacterium]MDE3107083.1 PIG-L family deacetylase [Acidobacteriota bacterium]MDE3223310.1 PIG-L family deacetylase [Acidobacteriota bacterium]